MRYPRKIQKIGATRISFKRNKEFPVVRLKAWYLRLCVPLPRLTHLVFVIVKLDITIQGQ